MPTDATGQPHCIVEQEGHTLVVTTVHELQVQPAGVIPTTGHDIHVDLVVTPDRVVECPRPRGWRTPALQWHDLSDEKIAAIPLLTRLRAHESG